MFDFLLCWFLLRDSLTASSPPSPVSHLTTDSLPGAKNQQILVLFNELEGTHTLRIPTSTAVTQIHPGMTGVPGIISRFFNLTTLTLRSIFVLRDSSRNIPNAIGPYRYVSGCPLLVQSAMIAASALSPLGSSCCSVNIVFLICSFRCCTRRS